jgi:hypothetical protein
VEHWDGPLINEENAASSCFVLLPVKERTDTYIRLGFFTYFQYVWDEDVPVQDLDELQSPLTYIRLSEVLHQNSL